MVAVRGQVGLHVGTVEQVTVERFVQCDGGQRPTPDQVVKLGEGDSTTLGRALCDIGRYG